MISLNLKTASEGINDSSNLVGAIIHDKQLKGNLKVLLESLHSGSKTLNEDLEALQHNFFFRSYFRKKEKQNVKDLKMSRNNGSN